MTKVEMINELIDLNPFYKYDLRFLFNMTWEQLYEKLKKEREKHNGV